MSTTFSPTEDRNWLCQNCGQANYRHGRAGVCLTTPDESGKVWIVITPISTGGVDVEVLDVPPRWPLVAGQRVRMGHINAGDSVDVTRELAAAAQVREAIYLLREAREDIDAYGAGGRQVARSRRRGLASVGAPAAPLPPVLQELAAAGDAPSESTQKPPAPRGTTYINPYDYDAIMDAVYTIFDADQRNAENLMDDTLARELIGIACGQAEAMWTGTEEPLPHGTEIARRVAVALSSVYYGEVK